MMQNLVQTSKSGLSSEAQRNSQRFYALEEFVLRSGPAGLLFFQAA